MFTFVKVLTATISRCFCARFRLSPHALLNFFRQDDVQINTDEMDYSLATDRFQIHHGAEWAQPHHTN